LGGRDVGYKVREFCDRYEVNDKNGVWKPGQPLRVGAIDYIRAPVHGKNWTLAFREFNDVCGADAPMVYGVFCKLREIQADNVREYRDAIRDHKGRLLEADGIARILGWPVKSVEKALNLLSGEVLGWLEDFRGIPGDSSAPVSDHNQSIAEHTCAESVPASPPEPAAGEVFVKGNGPYTIDDEEVGMWFPVVGCKDTRGWPLTKAHAKQLRTSFKAKFPDPEVMRLEFEKARSWVINNPQRRKTPGGMPAFLNNWIGKTR